MKQALVILISGTGTNMTALVRAARREAWAQHFDAQITAVISNRPQAAGLKYATENGIPTAVIDHKHYPERPAFDRELMREIDAHVPQEAQPLVILAGFMRVLTPEFVRHYEGRLLNIHPSLLPAFPGLHTHQRALEAGCRFAGATVHQVTEELDCGAILEQAAVPILPSDTPETLAARVLTQEHVIYPRAVRNYLKRAEN